MTVRWDSLLVAALVRELRDRLSGGKVRAFHLDHGSRDVVLHLDDGTLVLRLHPRRGTVVLLDPMDPLPGARPYASRVREVTAPPDERRVQVHLLRRRGRSPSVDLVVDLIPNRWNAYVVETGTGVVRHVLHTPRKGTGAPAPGSVLSPPEPSTRLGAREEEPVPLERWMEALDLPSPDDRQRALLSTFAWTSRLNAPWFLVDGDLERGWERWNRIRRLPPAEPHLLSTDRGLQPYPFPLPHLEGEPRETLLDAFGEVADRAEEGGARTALLPSGLLEAAEREVRKAEGTVDRLQAELERAPDPDPLRAVGDLILARFHEVPQGVEEAVIHDFEGNEVRIELDPSLPPNENAARYYDRAARAERTRERLPGMVEKARRRLDRLRRLEEEVRRGRRAPGELAEVLGVPMDGPPDRKGKDPERGASLPYRRYRTSGGLEVRVGRGARENDRLTFHHSRPDDVWLHARQAEGAHVILRWDGEGKPPRRDLTEAATLAALHSRARTSGSVPVDWTRRKYVRKPRKAPPGAVVPDRVETVFVEPVEEAEQRLRED